MRQLWVDHLLSVPQLTDWSCQTQHWVLPTSISFGQFSTLLDDNPFSQCLVDNMIFDFQPLDTGFKAHCQVLFASLTHYFMAQLNIPQWYYLHWYLFLRLWSNSAGWRGKLESTWLAFSVLPFELRFNVPKIQQTEPRLLLNKLIQSVHIVHKQFLQIEIWTAQ